MDPWLEPFRKDLRQRYQIAEDWIGRINDTEGGLEKFSRVWITVCLDLLALLTDLGWLVLMR